ncbi:hypothetical protein AAVH_14383 [Aphelenchoides avenae]|nr:hypothetical protein AAVH_14383 [Aphelenchus avenae]
MVRSSALASIVCFLFVVHQVNAASLASFNRDVALMRYMLGSDQAAFTGQFRGSLPIKRSSQMVMDNDIRMPMQKKWSRLYPSIRFAKRASYSFA